MIPILGKHIKIYQHLGAIAKVLCLLLITTCCVAKQSKELDFDDWVVSSDCSQGSNILCILCDGSYKPIPLPPYIAGSAGQQIKVTADKAKFVAKGTSVFTGNVIATQNHKAIYADKANVVHDTNGDLQSISAIGHVKLLQPGVRVDGTKATAYVPQKREVVENAVYRIYAKHARGVARSAVIQNNTKLTLSDATYTTCAPESNAWHLAASTTELNKETGRGEAWNARLYLRNVPVFYFPYVNFPLDKRRQSGFLQPEFENSSLNGKTIIVPYYLNLAPNYDATITGNYMTLRGYKFDNVFRFLTKSSTGELNFDFLPYDRAYRALRNDLYANTAFMTSTNSDTVVRRNDVGNSNFRYRFAAKDVTYFNPNWLLTIDYTDASDGNYLYDFQTESPGYVTDQSSSLYALQRACLQNFNIAGTLRAQVERYQTFHVINGPSGTEQLTKLPAVDFNSTVYTLPGGADVYGWASYINFRPNVIPQSGTALTYGQRFHIRPAIGYPIEHPGWFILPRAQLNYVQYDHLNVSPTDLANGITPRFTQLAIPMFDLKTGMIFERTFAFRNRTVLQTLEPILYYLYVPRKNQNNIPNLDSGLLTFDYNQIYRDNRYTGGDYIGDANQLTLGVETKFFDSDTGAERGKIGLGKIKYFRNTILLLDQELDNTEKHWSPWVFVAQLNIAPDTAVVANLTTKQKTVEIASFQLQYRPSPVRVVNFAYEYVQDTQPDDLTGLLNSNVNQVSISTAWQVAAPWLLLGKINYDLRFHRFLESIAGLEYHTCCTAIRIVWARTWLAEISSNHGHENRLRVQFIFKGLGGIGNAEDRYIATVIPGYQPMK